MIKSRANILTILLSGIIMSLTGACSNVPDEVIPPDDMAEVMADLYMAESVIESNYQSFHDDSTKMALKQSIVENRGYTLAQLDTSFMWYGAHLKEYDKVLDKSTEVLNARLRKIDTRVSDLNSSANSAVDSTNVWSGASTITISGKSPSRSLSFTIDRTAQGGQKPGDQYTWRMKISNTPAQSRWVIAADYSDGTTEIMPLTFSGEGWKEITFYADSSLSAQRIYGSMMISPVNESVVILDSIQLIRHRLDRKKYPMRYRQRHYKTHN
ncbi:MAG: DUF4296 domain-containing protein [Muribaculaceae bacterium]|nr:DUF4296 domain-containing protein [Muribaculaceae bacterium]